MGGGFSLILVNKHFMQQRSLQLVVGLGNPGKAYVLTRHNAGFMAVDEVASTYSISFDKQKFNTIFGRGSIKGIDVILAKPMAFMNNSGTPVLKLAKYFRILSRDMLVIHDDIDLAYGRLKIMEKGGHGGHKGIRSLIDAFGGIDFTRLRIGIGRGIEISGSGNKVVGHVLGNFTIKEREFLNQIIQNASNAVVTILCKGTKEGMNRFNHKKIMI